MPEQKITREQTCAAIRSLGFDPNDVLSLTIDYEHVTVVTFKREDGRRYLADTDTPGADGFAKDFTNYRIND